MSTTTKADFSGETEKEMSGGPSVVAILRAFGEPPDIS